MSEDIRDKRRLSHDDILGLNFIKGPGAYYYRRHFRTGLRSHIMEVLRRQDKQREHFGVFEDGLRWFRRARPVAMLRLFRTRFKSLNDAAEEIKRVRLVEVYLAPDHLGKSNEFLVDYSVSGKFDLLLCGLQDYVEGEILDPWSPLDRDHLLSLCRRMGIRGGNGTQGTCKKWLQALYGQAENFVSSLKKMILEGAHVPDLAGVGNLLVTPFGEIKLVDINNISKVRFNSTIMLDDRAYPVSDKSIEALALLEQKLLRNTLSKKEILYRTFLDPERMKEVKELVRKFHERNNLSFTPFPD